MLSVLQLAMISKLEKIISELEQISFSYLVLKQNEALIFISNYGGELIFFQINPLHRPKYN